MSPEQENGEGHVDGFDDSETLSEDDLVTITDDSGNEYLCVILEVIEYEGAEYVMLSPRDQLEDDEAEEIDRFLFLYQLTDDGTPTFSYIEDDNTFDAVLEIFNALL